MDHNLQHTERAHAVLSPSSSIRWLNCTASALIESEFTDTTSTAALEGTVAHELAEAKVKYMADLIDDKELEKTREQLRQHELWDDEMEEYTDSYKTYIWEQRRAFKTEPYIQIEKKLDLGNYIEGGFGTADCIMIGDDTLQVIDFKYGKGVKVEADNNTQMLLYALGAYDLYKIIYKFSKVKMSIVQPRLANFDEWTIDVEDLLKFGEFAKTKATEALSGAGEFVPGQWCRFCRAKATCRARADENIKLFSEVDKTPDMLTNEEIGKYLEAGEDVAKWLKDLQEYALSECLKGHQVQGYKAVEGRGSRDWVDMDKAFKTLEANGYEEAMLYERKPLTLAQTEKLVGKKKFNELVGDLVNKKVGKPALVPESDKREAITNNLKADEFFKEDK